MVHSGCGASWAAASARTLARRLRRQRRNVLGETRAAALAWRTAALRRSLDAHWRLGDRLGGHAPALSDAIRAGRLLGLASTELAVAEEALDLGNWARHAAPPLQVQIAAPPVGARSGSP